MNIGIFTDTYVPQVNGVVTVIRNLEKGLKERGHNVYIFTVEHPEAMPMDNVFRLPSIKFIWEPQHRLGFPVSPTITKKVKKLNLDIIHSHTEFSLLTYARYISKKLKIPTVHTTHTFYEEYLHYVPLFEKVSKFYLKKEMKKICDRQKAVVAPSNKIKNVLLGYDVSSPIEVVPNGIDLSKFYKPEVENIDESVKIFKKNFGIKDNEKVLVFVGRIAQEKSIDKLLENMKVLNEKRKDIKLLLIGDGPEKHALQKYASKLGIDDKVIFAGYLKWPIEISIAYRASNIFMSASHSEVHPMTFIEAIASGLPVVAYDDPSIDEMILNEVNGYKYKDKNQMWEGVIKILEDEEKRKEMIKQSIEISKNYSMEVFVERMINVYERYLR